MVYFMSNEHNISSTNVRIENETVSEAAENLINGTQSWGIRYPQILVKVQ